MSMSELVDGCRYICFAYCNEYRIVHYNKYGMASIKAVVKWDKNDVIRSLKMRMKWKEYFEAILEQQRAEEEEKKNKKGKTMRK